MEGSKRVCVVEDDFLIAEDLRRMCEDFGFEVTRVIHRAEGAAEAILAARPDVLLMDVRLGQGPDGIAIVRALNQLGADIRVVFVTGSTEQATRMSMRQEDPHRILVKPVSQAMLKEALGA